MLSVNGPTGNGESTYSWTDICEFIVPLPERVFLTAEQAQTAMDPVLRNLGFGLPSSASLQSKNLVLRLFLTSARSFKRTLRKRGMGSPLVEDLYRRLPMPHFIWICEIADYSEYAKEHKVLGELIWDATRNAHEPDGLVANHLPETLTVNVGSAFNKPTEFRQYPLPTQNSYFLFDSNLHSL